MQNFYISATFSDFVVTKLWGLKAFQAKFVVCRDIFLHTVNVAWKALRPQSCVTTKSENAAEV